MRRALLAFVVLAFALTGPVRASAPDGVPVLMYHKVDPHAPSGPVGRSLTLAPEGFAAQLAWLRAHAIRTLTMDELTRDLARGVHPQRAVVLTFDDGYTDAATVVTPLLLRYGARATFYVSAGFIGDARHASWAQLRAMRAAGMEIGCHGTHHLDLTTVGPKTAAYEVNHCAAALAQHLAPPTTYAYAAGKFNRRALELVRAAHFAAAVTERPGVVRSLAAPYVLPRRRIDRATSLASFAALATP